MARSPARRVGPRGPGPDTFRSEVDQAPRMFSPAIPQHTPGPFCGACNPTPCRVVGCAGHVHHVQADGEKRCDACKRRS